MLLLNDEKIIWFKFPGGEVQVKLPDNIKSERVTLTWLPTNSDDMLLLLAANALKHYGIYDVHLDCLYLPYARQDRVCSPGEAFSLKVICELLNSMNFSQITLWDTHNSDETRGLLYRSNYFEVECYDIFARFKILDNFDLDNLILCSPDRGSVERVDNVAEHFKFDYPIELWKKRDLDTGEITGLEFHNVQDFIVDQNVLVIDDICDGGRTFVEAAKLLKTKTDGKLYLYVTHGIFSNGLSSLLQYYDHIYCHHVLDNDFKSNDRLTILREFTNE